MICATIINTHNLTHRQADSFWPVILLVPPAELIKTEIHFCQHQANTHSLWTNSSYSN